jgi:alkylation response protein AidB-like acyl-CoA dehydrogenase
VDSFGTSSQRETWLPALASGREPWAIAMSEARATFDKPGVASLAARDGDAFVLSGQKMFVRGATSAQTFVIAARLDDGLGLFIVPRDADGLAVSAQPNIGDDDQGLVVLDCVRAGGDALLGGRPLGWEALDHIATAGALLECGCSIGLMAQNAAITVGYVKERVQFGRPIGSFQSVQHQIADQATDVDCARYLTYYAAWALDEDVPSASVEVARAKAWVSDALRRVTRTGNQLHGGMGFSREYDLHFYYQRAKTLSLMFGNADVHRERVATALLD